MSYLLGAFPLSNPGSSAHAYTSASELHMTPYLVQATRLTCIVDRLPEPCVGHSQRRCRIIDVLAQIINDASTLRHLLNSALPLLLVVHGQEILEGGFDGGRNRLPFPLIQNRSSPIDDVDDGLGLCVGCSSCVSPAPGTFDDLEMHLPSLRTS